MENELHEFYSELYKCLLLKVTSRLQPHSLQELETLIQKELNPTTINLVIDNHNYYNTLIVDFTKENVSYTMYADGYLIDKMSESVKF